MGRLKCQGNVRSGRDSRLPCNRDTPLKTGLSRGRGKYRGFLSKNHFEPLLEEPLLTETSVPSAKPSVQLGTNRKPIRYKKAASFSSPVFTENLREKNISATTPTNQNANPAYEMTPDPGAFKGGAMPLEDEALYQTGSLERVATTSMEQTTSVSSDDGEEDCYSSTSSSLPSPEVFCREDNYVESLTFPLEEELLDLRVKNSTLLDVSHAENIHMHPPPNLSAIMDASVIPAEKEHEPRGTGIEPRRCMGSFEADKPSKRTTPKFSNRRPIQYKKVVRFHSPVTAESHTAKNNPAAKLTNQNAGDPVQTCSSANRMTADAFKAGEIIPKEDTQPLTAPLDMPANTSPEPAKFWDFADDDDRDAFFQRWRDRNARLKSAPDFLSKLIAD